MDRNQPDERSEQTLDETAARRLIQAALDGPARPLRQDQVEALAARAAARWSRPVPGVPLWALGALCAGVLVVGLAWLAGSWKGILQAALLIPLANLALSPVAAWVIIKHIAKRKHQQGGEQC